MRRAMCNLIDSKLLIIICRFFYVLDSPSVIVFFGFTKETQKTDKKDVEQGLRNFQNYRDYQRGVSINDVFG